MEKEQRLACLEFACKVGMDNGDSDNIVPNAEKFWQRLNGSHDAAQTPKRTDEDIPF